MRKWSINARPYNVQILYYTQSRKRTYFNTHVKAHSETDAVAVALKYLRNDKRRRFGDVIQSTVWKL